MAGANRCPICGLERPAIAPEGSCPRCLLRQALKSDTPGPVDVDATTAPDAASSGDSPEPAPADFDATGAHMPRLGAEATTALANATGSGIPDADSPTQPADGYGAVRDLPRGETVRCFGDYELQREIARGGMGVVFKARQVKLNRQAVALKMILAGNSSRVRPRSSASTWRPRPPPTLIIPALSLSSRSASTRATITSAWALSRAKVSPSESPRVVLACASPAAEAASLMVQIAEAVQYAHEKEVIHTRDLKPSNVLLDAHGHPKLTDFGLAKKLQYDSGLTASGQIMGTPSYMPPEQAQGRGDIGPLADVYSLGAILFCLLDRSPAVPGGQCHGGPSSKFWSRRSAAPRTTWNAAIPLDLETIAAEMPAKGTAPPLRLGAGARRGYEPVPRRRADPRPSGQRLGTLLEVGPGTVR